MSEHDKAFTADEMMTIAASRALPPADRTASAFRFARTPNGWVETTVGTGLPDVRAPDTARVAPEARAAFRKLLRRIRRSSAIRSGASSGPTR